MAYIMSYFCMIISAIALSFAKLGVSPDFNYWSALIFAVWAIYYRVGAE